jgi:protein ImuB
MPSVERLERCLVLWFPGWPVTAWALAGATTADHPVAVVAANRVVACSAAADAEGVLPGQRRREAHSRCPTLQVVAADQARDAREFEPVLEAVEHLTPGVQQVRPGLCAVRSRGLAGYLGSEVEAAEVLLEAIANLGIPGGRIGIADGLFTAQQAARSAHPVQVVPPGGSGGFLASLPVSRLDDEALTTLLPRLGVHTLGGFAALAPELVRERFGESGVRLHALAAGRDGRPVQPRVPPPELAREVSFEPPLVLVDQVAFAARATAEAFIAGLTAARLACTEVRVELHGDRDELLVRTWLTPSLFDAAAVVDRIRWQLQAAGERLRSGIVGLRLEPVATDALAHHTPGLFGLGPDERVHHALSRVQAMLGHEGVLTPAVGGGRWLAERQVLVPWGDRPTQAAPAGRPWPGQVPAPLPATVFAAPLPARLLDSEGRQLRVDERGRASGVPARFGTAGRHHRVLAWAGPWPVDERTWDAERHRRACRYQVVDSDQTAWLVVVDDEGCWVEARYD